MWITTVLAIVFYSLKIALDISNLNVYEYPIIVIYAVITIIAWISVCFDIIIRFRKNAKKHSPSQSLNQGTQGQSGTDKTENRPLS